MADAVRMSMSIPYFYEPVKLGDSWFVDGGMLSNFPVGALDAETASVRAGRRLVSISARPGTNQAAKSFKGPVSFAKAMVGTMTNFHDQMHLDRPDVIDRTIVDTGKVQATDSDLDRNAQDFLYENGRSPASKFLGGWDFDAYVERYRSY